MKIGVQDTTAPGVADYLARKDAEAVTPGRHTLLHLDLPETKMVSAGFAGLRSDSDIAHRAARTGGQDGANSKGVKYWPGARCWTLQPLQDRLTLFSEALPLNAVVDDLILKPQVTNLYGVSSTVAAIITEQVAWSTPAGEGMVHRPNTLPFGDPFYYKSVAANGSYAAFIDTLTPTPQGVPSDTTPGTSGLAPPVAPMDYVHQTVTLRPDKGIFLRWVVPGVAVNHPDYLLNCYFGQYCVVLTGDGQAHLCEYCRATTSGPYRWMLRTTFRYCKPSQVSGVSHSLGIFPIMSLSGPCIEFWGAHVEGASLDGGVSTPQSFTYFANALNRGSDVDEAPGHVTKSAPNRLDIRRDLRLGWQTSRLLFQPSGYMYSGVWGGRGISANPPYSVRPTYRTPWPPNTDTITSNAAVTSAIINPATLLPIETGYNGPVGIKFNFTGHIVDGKQYSRETPILFSYSLVEEPYILAVNPATENPDFAPLTIPIASVDFTVQGPSPTNDDGHVLTFDQTNEYARLRTRGLLPAKLTTTTKKPDGTDEIVTLFRGEVQRPRYTRFGKPGRVFPHEMSGGYSLTLSGLYTRLEQQSFTGRMIDFRLFVGSENLSASGSFNTANGPVQGWRITSIIKYLLGLAFPPSMIEIDDINIPLFSTVQASTNVDLWYTPHADVLSLAQTLVRNYLGGYLIFDVAAGVLAPAGRPDAGSPEGAWKIIFTPPEGTTPLLHFSTGHVSDGTFRLPFKGHPAGTVVECGRAESYAVPPEINHVHVFTAPLLDGEKKGYRYEAHAYNVLSYDVPNCPTRNRDPLNPHWIGRERLRVIPDPSLYDSQSPANSVAAVNFIARRVLNYAGRGGTAKPIHGPLAFITDPNTGRQRLPRFGDPCSYDGEPDWFLRSISPAYNSDRIQLANYEIIRFEPLYKGVGN